MAGILANKKSNYTGTTETENLKRYLSDLDQDVKNLFLMSPIYTFGYGSTNNVLVNRGGWDWAWTGTMGGWSIAGNLLYAGSGGTYIGLQPSVGMWFGDEAFLNGAFSVDPNGVIKAHSGTIGGWNLSTTRLYSTNILIDSSNEYIRTTNYVSGALGQGWNIDNTLAEFNNIRARGKIVTSVFEKDTISTVGGSFLVADSDILNVDMASSDTSNVVIVGDTTFAVGDFLRIKDGVDDEWFQVSAVSSTTYTVARDKAGVYSANSNPAWKKGTAVANFGTSGEGVVFMTASESNAPYLSVVTHSGSPWTTLYTQARLGNLNGFMDYSTDKYGIAMGSGNSNLVIDQSNGIRIRKNLTDLVAIDTAGNAYISGTVLIGGASGVSASTLTSISGTQLLDNGNFEDWSAGDSVAPDGWILVGANATIARQASTVKIGSNSAHLTRVGTDCQINQDISAIKGIAYWQGRTVTFSCWVYATAANRVSLQLVDGITTPPYSYHTGSGTWELLSVTGIISNSATFVKCALVIDTGNTFAYFDGAMMVEGSYPVPYADKFKDWGYPSNYTLIDGGDIYAGSSITIGSSGTLKSGMTAYNVGTGWWIGDVSGTPKFSIGNSASTKTLTWDGTNLSVANVQSPDYVSNTSGYYLSASSGLEINAGSIQGTPLIAKLMVYAMMFGS